MSADLASESIDLAHEPAFRLGAARVTPATGEVIHGQLREVLQPRVMQVLVALAQRRGQVVSGEDLIALCWGGRVVGDDAVHRCIGLIRKLAEQTGAFAVETAPRVGYRLRVHPRGLAALGRPGLIGLAALALAGSAGAAWIMLRPERAVAPQVQVTSLSTAGTGSEGVATVLRDNLLSVLNQSGVQTVADDRRGGPGRADLVIKGSVSRQGERLIAYVFIEDTASGLTLWSGRFSQPAGAAESLADEVAVAATETLYAALEPGKQAGASPDAQTLALYVRGAELIRSPQPDRQAEPRRIFEQVVARAPNLAAGHADLAVAIVNEARRAPPSARPALLAEAERAARKAIAIDPAASGAAYDALYLARRLAAPSDIVAAESQLLEGLRRAPDFPFLLMRECRLLLEVGRPRAAEPYCERAVALRPLAAPIGYTYARMLQMAGEPARARDALTRAARRSPGHQATRLVRFQAAAFGDAPRSAVALLDDPSSRPDVSEQGELALRTYLAARESRSTQDVERAIHAIHSAAFANRLSASLAVPAAVRLGRLDEAYDLLARLDTREAQVAGDMVFLVDPTMAALRADRRFWLVAGRLGLADFWAARSWPDFCGRELSADACRSMLARTANEARARIDPS